MIGVNVGAALWLTQAVVPYLRDRGPGSIVHAAARPDLSRPPGWPPPPSARLPGPCGTSTRPVARITRIR
jgi:NAD(P)-dependent dehydrogenase (short-subunit alcohol dehydrogenase family)